jgi:hypothetical protein
MIHDWRAVILKEQQHSYQHSVENEWMVTQHRHRGMLFASVRFISQFALGSARAHGNLTARSSLPACSGAFWKSIDYLVPTSSRKDCGYEPHRWWFQCPLEYQTWRLNISQLTTDWTRGKCPRRSRPQNAPIVPQGDLLPTLKLLMTFDGRSYSWRQSGERTMPRTTRPKARPTRPTRTTGDEEGEEGE